MAQMVKVIKVFERADYVVVEWHNEYVACWCPRTPEGKPLSEENERKEVTCYWGQGHYFGEDFKGAIKYALEKEADILRAQFRARKQELDRMEKELSTLVENF